MMRSTCPLALAMITLAALAWGGRIEAAEPFDLVEDYAKSLERQAKDLRHFLKFDADHLPYSERLACDAKAVARLADDIDDASDGIRRPYARLPQMHHAAYAIQVLLGQMQGTVAVMGQPVLPHPAGPAAPGRPHVGVQIGPGSVVWPGPGAYRHPGRPDGGFGHHRVWEVQSRLSAMEQTLHHLIASLPY